jgi:hypothetical protein
MFPRSREILTKALKLSSCHHNPTASSIIYFTLYIDIPTPKQILGKRLAKLRQIFYKSKSSLTALPWAFSLAEPSSFLSRSRFS